MIGSHSYRLQLDHVEISTFVQEATDNICKKIFNHYYPMMKEDILQHGSDDASLHIDVDKIKVYESNSSSPSNEYIIDVDNNNEIISTKSKSSPNITLDLNINKVPVDDATSFNNINNNNNPATPHAMGTPPPDSKIDECKMYISKLISATFLELNHVHINDKREMMDMFIKKMQEKRQLLNL